MGPVTKPDTGYQSITIPADNQRGCFVFERLQALHGTRIAIRVGKIAIFFSNNEAAQAVEAISKLLGGARPGVRL